MLSVENPTEENFVQQYAPKTSSRKYSRRAFPRVRKNTFEGVEGFKINYRR